MSGVYISYPFCAQKCTFCNFASGVFPPELERSYVDCLLTEIEGHQWTFRPDTVYLGGGTPGRLPASELSRILSAVPGRPWREATLEAAPGTLTPEAVRGWREAGINRVSLGVQSFVHRELSRTGRRHNAQVVEADISLLRSEGISNISIDLIAGLPFQTSESWSESLDWVERLRPPHVSIYMLEVDEDSHLGLEVLQEGSRYSANAVPDEERVAELYENAVARLNRIGLARYEISNFALAGAESLHNLKYWQLDPYIGFGADAHSFSGGMRWGNVETAQDYVTRTRSGAPVSLERQPAIPDEERFFVGLRLARGVSAGPADLARYGSSIERLVEAGLLSVESSTLRLTDRGVLFSNDVFGEFIS